MKKLIILILIALFTIPVYAGNKKPYLPFARKGKYGKLPTKKARQKALFREQSWCYRQWGR